MANALDASLELQKCNSTLTLIGIDLFEGSETRGLQKNATKLKLFGLLKNIRRYTQTLTNTVSDTRTQVVNSVSRIQQLASKGR
jgi:hypothetical protein